MKEYDSPIIKKIIEVLNLAQCEIRAMYKRLKIRDSNILTLIDNAVAKLSDSEPNETKQIIKGLSGEKIESIPTFTSTDYPVYNENYLKECIKKAEPNLSKIKDVDKELADIRGESNLDFKKKLLDFLIWYQPDNEVAEDIIDKYLSV